MTPEKRVLLTLAAVVAVVSAAALEARAEGDGVEFFVDEAELPFDALEGTDTIRRWGVHRGAGFRIEVPSDWNRRLVMYAHGFRGDGPELTVSNPAIREYLVENGYAWAASSYSRNHYDVRAGVLDTNKLVKLFGKQFGRPEKTYIHGHSMGGHITGVAIEMFPNVRCPTGKPGRSCRFMAELLSHLSGGVRYDGAVPMCGVMGDVELFDYFTSYPLLAQAITGVPAEFPDPNYADKLPLIIALLSADAANGLVYPFFRSPAGDTLRAALQQMSGGVRPTFQAGYDDGFLFWESFFFLAGFGGGDGTLAGVEERVIVDNSDIFYQLDSDPAASPEEVALNEAVLRVSADPEANERPGPELQNVPEIRGRISIPVVSLHTLGDLFVPFVMEQIYAREVAAQGRSDLLVQRAIRDVNHCGFSVLEQEQAFEDMVRWVEDGAKPAGDDVLDPATLADPDYGCAFTTPDRDGAPPCP